jgi:N-acetyl-anhydromuramyl-L-alanine amidase AmpD
MNLDVIPYVAAVNQSPATGQPRLIVIHCMECPIETGRAGSVAHWFAGPSSPQASAHYMVDPSDVWCGVLPPAEAWHCGNANQYAGGASIGIEQTGYAAYDAEWLGSADAQAQMDRLVDLVRSLCDRYGISQQWLTADQLHAGVSGITTHGFLSSIGMGTDHTDPGPNWPHEEFMRRLTGGATPQPSQEDTVNVWLMRAKNDPAVWVVQANLSSRWHLKDANEVAAMQYVLGLNGGKILTPPADTKPEQCGAAQCWVTSPDFLGPIPIAK